MGTISYMVQIAIIGDVHQGIDAADIRYLNGTDIDLVLLTGDLASWWPWEAEKAAGILAGLQKPALFIAGNHDTVYPHQLLAEVFGWRRLSRLFSLGQARRAGRLRQALGPVIWGGFSTHTFSAAGLRFDVIAGRPLSHGGPTVAYRSYLERQFEVTTMAEASQRLCQCVDQARSDQLIFLAHNGPTGLGAKRGDIWGRDFVAEEGDHGDPDLQAAVAYAVQRGKRVIAVVAGHMHQQLKGGGRREWYVVDDGIHYINAAQVPRIFEYQGQTVHHHVRLSFDESTVEVTEMLVPS